MVTLAIEGKDTKVFLEANPQYKNITVYNNKMQRLDHTQRQELMKQPEMAKEQVKEQSKSLDGEDKKGKKQKTNKEETGLLPKKRSSENKKGLGV